MNRTARKILATAIALPLLSTVSHADVLADWTFEGSPLSTNVTGTVPGVFAPNTGVLTSGDEATGLHASSATVWSAPAGNGSTGSISSNNWASGDYYQFKVSTTGYDTIQVLFDQTGSNTGPRDFSFQYSTDGTTFTPLASLAAYSITNDAWSTTTNNPISTHTADMSAISTVSNQSFVFFRIIDNSATAINGAAVASAGTGRVDNFIVSGQTFVPTVDRFWDGNGVTAGVGGSGTWSGTSLTWNDAADGTGSVTALAALQKAVFGGTAGTITIGPGADANGGMRFATSGYVLSGAGTLNLSATANRIEVTNAADVATINAGITGTTGLEKTGMGTLILGGNNTYAGGTKVTFGTLQIANDSALGDSAGALVLNGAILKTTATTTLNSNRNVSGTGTLDIAPGSTLTVSGNATTGLLVLANAGALMLSGATQSLGGLTFMQAATVTSNAVPLTFTGGITTTNTTGTAVVNAPLDLGSSSHTFNVANGSAAVDLQINGAITKIAATGATLVKTGDGTLDLSGSNLGIATAQLGITGTTPTNGGTLIVHDQNGLGTGTTRLNLGTLRNGTAGLLSFNIGVSLGGQGATGVTLEGSDFEFFGSAAFTVFQNPAVTQYAQRITANANVYLTTGLNDLPTPPTGASVSAGLIIGGTGHVTLNSPTNTFTLPVTVDGGRLDVIGSLSGTAQGKMTIQNGGTLSGNQDLNSSIGAVEVAGNGNVAPGTLGDINGIPADPTGTLNTKNLAFDLGSFYRASVGGTTTGQFDQLNVTGTVTLAGNFIVTLEAGYTPVKNDTFIIINNDGADPVSGQFANAANDQVFPIVPGGNQFFRINYFSGDGNDVALIVVPEPATAGLMLLGGLALAARRRPRAKA